MHKKGLFITIEGIEGGGKSTQTKLLADYLENKGYEVVNTREPGGSEGAESIRELLINGSVDKWDGITELLLMFAARRDHVEKKIKPALLRGKIVICDRFYDSSYAYQGHGHNMDLAKIDKIKEVTVGNFKPDLTFVLDLDVREGINRKQNQNEKNRFEDMNYGFHERVRAGFLEICKKENERCMIINSQKNSIDEIHNIIIKKIEKTL
ncbi:dTMP kinase [Pseudomonadota bacterium]